MTVTEATERSILHGSGKSQKSTCRTSSSSASKKGVKDGLEGLEENPLALETCQITVPTQTLVELVYQTLLSAETSSDPER